MDRRLLVVPGALLLLVLIADVGVFRWQATYHAGPGLDQHPTVNATDLPARCADTAVALADGNNVSIRGYRIAPESHDILVERTSASGEWALGETNCADRLSGVANLRVDGESYRVLGTYSGGRPRPAAMGLAKLGAGAVGVALLAVGLFEAVRGEPG
ncbi:hypothetical protein ABNG02_00825 [Halorubrum ejinorense]|uniref:RING-type E3 ubiquitin transferase n=1 Tax=Halorubrum ejinorense TaxID=425309 RepID=A0AAV3SNW4_9EURY